MSRTRSYGSVLRSWTHDLDTLAAERDRARDIAVALEADIAATLAHVAATLAHVAGLLVDTRRDLAVMSA